MSEQNGKLFGKRKFVVTLISLGMSFVMCLWKLTPEQAADVWPWVVGLHLALYGGANVAEHLAKTRTNGGEE
jgi:hypothetical protein